MTFKEWLFSSYNNPSTNGQWGLLHILTLVFCAIAIIALTLIFRKKSTKAKRIVLFVLAGILLCFEITRRVVNLCKIQEGTATLNSILNILLPRPWCAISCWAIILSVFINKKYFYNFTSISALLCAIIFFAYPGVGFNNKFLLFENVYSIITHSLLLISSICLITLNFTKFEYKKIWQEGICYGAVLIYAFIEIFILKIESDPLYFMPNGDIQEMFNFDYLTYLLIYIAFMFIYVNLFYLISHRKKQKMLK